MCLRVLGSISTLTCLTPFYTSILYHIHSKGYTIAWQNYSLVFDLSQGQARSQVQRGGGHYNLSKVDLFRKKSHFIIILSKNMEMFTQN